MMDYMDINYSPTGANVSPVKRYLQSSTQMQPSTMGVTAPGLAGFGKGGFGLNMDTLGMAVQGLGTVGNLWNAFQAQKLAKEQFNFSKQFAEKNLANQIKAYNTTLADRGRSRATAEGQTPEQAAEYIEKNKL